MRGKQFVSMDSVAVISADDALESFDKHNRARNLRPRTRQEYQYQINHFFSLMNIEAVSAISSSTVEDYVLLLQQKGQKDTTIATSVVHVRAFLYYCMEQGWLPRFKVKVPKYDAIIKEGYTREEIEKLVREPASRNFVEWRTWAFIFFLLCSGARLSTALAVRIEDIDFKSKKITLRQTKNRIPQVIPLASSLAAALQKYLSLYCHEDSDFLFSSAFDEGGSKPICISIAQQCVRRYNRSRGVERTGCHDFRRTFAREYIVNGGGAFQLQSLLGHSSMEVSKRYVRLYGSDLDRGFDNLVPVGTR